MPGRYAIGRLKFDKSVLSSTGSMIFKSALRAFVTWLPSNRTILEIFGGNSHDRARMRILLGEHLFCFMLTYEIILKNSRI